ncbi:MAG: hypothetical protein ACLGG0_06845 [Bacteriovoracia bacterium]
MILWIFLITSSFADSDQLMGQYFHAKAETSLIEFLEAKELSIPSALQDDKINCVGVEEFAPTLDAIRTEAQATLSDLKNNGFRWRQPQTYGKDEKILMPPDRARAYANERLRFFRLEAFGRLSRLAPGCLNIFRQDPTGTRKSNDIPRFRLESLKNVTPEAFCSVTMRYWKELYSELPAACKVAADE